ncbi:MAG: hypothetical protein N2749_03675 [Clostridia bacterium]|nr:hypothetical protein [Clostridia bacterium]
MSILKNRINEVIVGKNFVLNFITENQTKNSTIIENARCIVKFSYKKNRVCEISVFLPNNEESPVLKYSGIDYVTAIEKSNLNPDNNFLQEEKNNILDKKYFLGFVVRNMLKACHC